MREINAMAMLGNDVAIAVDGEVFLVEMTPDQLRSLAIELCLAADRKEGVASPPAAHLLSNFVAGSA